ncbi:MAG: PAS domain-containing sensor histidine kinase [Alkalinema sp. CAN_BIN05]|nr:PAS domain-containing sensor histidine kinase [Alkalinema sp. CAN_BIN05]
MSSERAASSKPSTEISTDLLVVGLDILPEPIVITTPDGQIHYANNAAMDLFQGQGNIRSSRLLTQSILQWIRPEDWTQISYRMQRAASYDLDATLCLDDSAKSVAVALRQLSTPDRDDMLWLWRIQDLTQQRQQEANWLEQTAVLERSSRHMSEFLSNMSHELRTPLTSILGFSSMLKQKIFGELNEKQHVYVQHIHQSGQYLLALINDILDLSKIEAGHLLLEKTSISIAVICGESIEPVQQQAQMRQIIIRCHLDSDLKTLWAEDIRVRQMLLNLLSNAVKFSEEGGVIEVRTTEKDGMLCIAVKDNGIGIAPEKHHLIFKPFQQVDESIARRRQGTGLGLALTKHLAELHGGTVTFESAINQGSCFVLKLPIGSGPIA